MIRNENDVILPFLRQCAALFDKLLVADVQSTDGTATVMRRFADPRLEIQVYEVDRQEKYQSALMNCLSREAFAQGADWVFFLDADEFIDVQNRAELERYLQEVGSDVLMAPWINLVPTQYGNYNTFDRPRISTGVVAPQNYTQGGVVQPIRSEQPGLPHP